ncbi:Membrane family protein [uncultured Mycobacterium sp.]|uniref:Membrane family protein n=1 Tax=uncultured Mycobacterium sp. TaxID=171292 RepID=A0A1Y5PCD4_9MYCO|nr:Membrane family protein [uncultured Mycobacterium sp.]
MTTESQTYTSEGASTDNDAQAGPDQQKPQPAGHRTKRRGGPMTLLRKVWLPVVILLVVAVAAFGVFRLHGVFGKTELTRPGSGLANDTKPFNPKTVVYEIYGPPGAVATINYLDLDAQPQIARDVTLPWSLTLTTTAPAASANIVAQGDTDSIGCRITVNGELKDEKTSTGVNAQTFCLVKSA